MSSISDLAGCARRHLDHYTDPAGLRAFWTYDRQGAADVVEPVDALAPALLDAPVHRSVVVAMFAAEASPAADLRQAMQRLLDETAGDEPRFEDLDLDDESGQWQLVRDVLRCTNGVRGVRASKATKMLHRKRPLFVPIFDSKVAAFYGVRPAKPWDLWPVLQADLREAMPLIAALAAGVRTPDGRALAPLRALDIAVWEHVVTGCDAASGG